MLCHFLRRLHLQVPPLLLACHLPILHPLRQHHLTQPHPHPCHHHHRTRHTLHLPPNLDQAIRYKCNDHLIS